MGHPVYAALDPSCVLRGVPMNSKLLDFFTYYLNLPLKNVFFQFPTALRKLTANDKNQEIFSIEKRKDIFFFSFFRKRSPILFQN